MLSLSLFVSVVSVTPWLTAFRPRLTANPFTQIHPFVSHERRDGDDCRLFPASLDCMAGFAMCAASDAY